VVSDLWLRGFKLKGQLRQMRSAYPDRPGAVRRDCVSVAVQFEWGERRRLISARKARADERKEYQAKLAAG
jgi:hypothetical protein